MLSYKLQYVATKFEVGKLLKESLRVFKRNICIRYKRKLCNSISAKGSQLAFIPSKHIF